MRDIEDILDPPEAIFKRPSSGDVSPALFPLEIRTLP